MSNLFTEIMDKHYHKLKTDTDNSMDAYSSSNILVNNLFDLLVFCDSIDEMTDKAQTLQAKYFGQAIKFIQNEDYEYVQKCITIIDIISKLLYKAIKARFKSELSKSEIKAIIEGIDLGIEEVKHQLANGDLYSEEAKLYE